MAPPLTAEDVVRRIAAECAYVDERGGVGIRLEPAAASCGGMGNNFAGRSGVNPCAGHRKRNRFCNPCAL